MTQILFHYTTRYPGRGGKYTTPTHRTKKSKSGGRPCDLRSGEQCNEDSKCGYNHYCQIKDYPNGSKIKLNFKLMILFLYFIK